MRSRAGANAISVTVTLMVSLFLQKTPVQIWLYDQKDMRIEGTIIVSCPLEFFLDATRNSFVAALQLPRFN